MSWDKTTYRGSIELRGTEVNVYHSGCSGFHATISVGKRVRSAYWYGDDVMVITEDGEKRVYRNSSTWGRA